MGEKTRSLALPILILAGLIGALVQIAVLWLTPLPLGVPGEWVWPRNEFDLNIADLFPVVLCGLLLSGYVFYFGKRIEGRSRPQVWGLLLGLSLLGGGWLYSLIAAAPGIAGSARVPFVLYYERSSGYFWQARHQVDNLKDFLQTYDERIADSDKSENYLHLGTHPPGLTTFFVGLIRLFEASPALTDLVLATQPEVVRESFDVLRQNEQLSGRDVRRADVASLWLAAVLVGAGIVFTSCPLYWIAQRYFSAEAAWNVAAFWLLVPAGAIFLPKSDAFFPCLTMLVQWQWLTALDRNSWRWGLATGLTMFGATFLSLAFVPVGLMLVLQFCLLNFGEQTSQPASWWQRRRWPVLWSSAASFLLPVLLLWGISGLKLPLVWVRNLTNHASFYAHHQRTYWAWLTETPLELAGALGMPLAILALVGLCWLLRSDLPRRGELLIPLAVWTFLWISGKNQGEAARLWIFLMPYAVLTAGVALNRLATTKSDRRPVAAFWVLQMITTAATVLGIDGFHFSELLPP